ALQSVSLAYSQRCSPCSSLSISARAPLCAALGLFFFQAEDGIRDATVTGVQTCALPISETAKQRQGGAGNNLVAQFPGPDAANHDRSPDSGSAGVVRRTMSPGCRPERTTTSVSLWGPIFTGCF